MKSVFLYPNMSKENMKEAILKVVDKLSEFNVEIFISKECDIEKLNKMDIKDFKGSLIITLGGDGTMLTAVNKCNDIPILGINLGHLGFLTELEINELHLLDKIFKNEFTIEKRMSLNLEIIREGKIISKEVALNDIIVKTENSFRIVNIEVFSDNKSILDFGGDGIIIATPTGSTAYSLAAGGPIIESDFEAICITPICSHSLFGKSFVLSTDREITIKIEERNKNIAFIAVDGNNNVRVSQNDIIKITKSSDYVPFLRIKGTTFFNLLKQKIGG